MKTIPPNLLKKFHQAKQGGDVVRTYTDRNPIVRWLYWDRLRKMLDMGKRLGGKRVLDLGCGEGVFLPALSHNFQQVYAIDIDTRAAEEVVKHYKLKNVKLFQTNFFDNPFVDGCFDIVFAASVLEHFPDRKRLFTEVVRIVAPEGYLIFSSPTETWFYQLGRKIFGYKKPVDHYFSASEIAAIGSKYLDLLEKKYSPFCKPSLIAAHCTYVFRKR